MLSASNSRTIKRRYDNEREMTQRQNRAHKIAFAKRLAKAIGVGLFAYITMITDQVAGWIAWPLIMWSIYYGVCTMETCMEWKWAPWQR